MIFAEGAPFSLEVEHIEIIVLSHKVNDPGFDISISMSEGTKISIFALFYVLGVYSLLQILFKNDSGLLSAIFSLVFFYMIQPLYSVMRKFTIIFVRAFFNFFMLT